MAKVYTHEFDISLGDGSRFLRGEASVDIAAKKNDHKIVDSPDPLPLEFFEDAISLLRNIEDLFLKYEGIKNIHFSEKTT